MGGQWEAMGGQWDSLWEDPTPISAQWVLAAVTLGLFVWEGPTFRDWIAHELQRAEFRASGAQTWFF